MVVVEVLVFAMGAILVLVTLRSAFRTLVVPRPFRAYLSRFVFVWLRRVFWLRANHRHTYERRDRVMAFYGPVSLFTLLGVWLTLVVTGYTAMFWAVGHGSIRDSFTESGSSLLTLGFAQERALPSVILAFTEATLGLTLLALLITYLPSLYQGFQRREAGVSKLEVRGGKPPSGTYLIELSWTVGHMGKTTDNDSYTRKSGTWHHPRTVQRKEHVVSEPVVSQAGVGARIDFGPMGQGHAKIGSKETDDAIGAWEFSLEGGGGAPPPHIHNSIHEVIVVLEGDAEIVIGDRTERVGSGGLVYAPPGTLHGVSPSGDGKIRAMILTTPASKHEEVIDAIGKLVAAGPPTPESIAKYLGNVDVEMPVPPA